MAKSDEEKNRVGSSKMRDRAAEVANTLEWLITAFALAFVFRAFIMEAFRIPTGSMADTLLGAHYRIRCTECGYKYYYGQSDFKPAAGQTPRQQMRQEQSRCPSCGYYQATGGIGAVSNGDRILVLKCLYQFEEPKQWDVVVFKNPLDPSINYIKRLVGRPNEQVEIIDGDVYINGQISRKPPKVQRELWMPVYDNDYQPARPEEPQFNRHTWRQPFRKAEDSKWVIDEESPTVFRLAGEPNVIHTLDYDTSLGNDFRATYAYDETNDYRFMPYCSDLMVRYWITPEQPGVIAGVTLGKYGIQYTGQVDFNGKMTITRISGQDTNELASETIDPPQPGRPVMLSFENLDHILVLKFGDKKVSYDLGLDANAAGEKRVDIEPQVRVFGAGKIGMNHLAIFRDIHYTDRNPYTNERCRAVEGNPLKLENDQFFMLGDNSPRSEDGRWWRTPGKGNNGRIYAAGTVPREYLVGKALFVYWPAGFKPFQKSPLALIPNFGELRFIYGGSYNVE